MSNRQIQALAQGELERAHGDVQLATERMAEKVRRMAAN